MKEKEVFDKYLKEHIIVDNGVASLNADDFIELYMGCSDEEEKTIIVDIINNHGIMLKKKSTKKHDKYLVDDCKYTDYSYLDEFIENDLIANCVKTRLIQDNKTGECEMSIYIPWDDIKSLNYNKPEKMYIISYLKDRRIDIHDDQDIHSKSLKTDAVLVDYDKRIMNEELKQDLDQVLQVLTTFEREVIESICCYQRSLDELALLYNLSKQTIQYTFYAAFMKIRNNKNYDELKKYKKI